MVANQRNIPSLREVLEANPIQLGEWSLQFREDTSKEARYTLIRRAFMADDRDSLRSILDSLRVHGAMYDDILLLGALRLAIREGTVGAEDMLTFVRTLEGWEHEDLWLAEATHMAAVGFECSGNDQCASNFYQKAYLRFTQNGSPLRAAISYHNYVAAESRIDPSKRLLIEYDHAFQLAQHAGDAATAGVALNNLAREFQLMKAPHAALKRSNEAIQLLSRTHFGSYQYLLALANRCDILLDLGYTDLACADYEEITCSQIPEVIGATQVLWSRAGKAHSWPRPTAEQMPQLPTWLERSAVQAGDAPAALVSAVFTPMETALIEALSQSSQTTAELVTKIYGDQGDFLNKENRIKQLLHRLKKKAPQLIVRAEGRYRLADNINS